PTRQVMLRTAHFLHFAQGLVSQNREFSRALAQVFDDLRWSLCQESLLFQLAFSICYLFLELLQLLAETLTFGGNVDLLFVDHVHVKARGMTRSSLSG